MQEGKKYTHTPQDRRAKDYLLLFSKGLAMGAADVVPGVSGGTIAFITGIYNELLHSLKNCNPAALTILFKSGPGAFWAHINGYFLLALFGGVLVSLKTLAAVIIFCMGAYPLLVWSFFSGLIIASVLILAKGQPRWRVNEWAFFMVGVVFVLTISVAKPTQLPGDWWILLLGGFIAICAMILPGISGSFILLLLGLYPVFLRAITDVDIIALASFGAGCVAGLMVFSHFLSWLLDRYMRPTIAVLMGFLVGSLNVTWPWKETLEVMINRHGEEVPLVQHNIGPALYSQVSGADPQIVAVIFFCVVGGLLVLSTEFVAHRYAKQS